ncbi:hypothetical protein [Methanotorris formicicus]|uniref:Uncharacterized protein n=1 Tax=Methanotorris formicicus Mc-S-70 TaxID=647171 RepID=H1L051_9EURY|nr:hypothetical protein [Methanotorris formicicus]EHP85185.1 hypothetical protein MetfoDRAFT_1425 [Methanotorris formicicus Mc-S-70]
MLVEYKMYDSRGNEVKDGDFHCIVFYIKKSKQPTENDLMVEAVNVKNIPLLVAKYVRGKLDYPGFGEPEEVTDLEVLKNYGVPEDIIATIKETYKKYGIDWV